jgi:hypothetical protein
MAPDPTGCARRDLFPQIHRGLHADGPRMPVPRRLRQRPAGATRAQPKSEQRAGATIGGFIAIGFCTLRQPASGRAPGLAAAECRGRPRGGLRRRMTTVSASHATGSNRLRSWGVTSMLPPRAPCCELGDQCGAPGRPASAADDANLMGWCPPHPRANARCRRAETQAIRQWRGNCKVPQDPASHLASSVTLANMSGAISAPEGRTQGGGVAVVR